MMHLFEFHIKDWHHANDGDVVRRGSSVVNGTKAQASGYIKGCMIFTPGSKVRVYEVRIINGNPRCSMVSVFTVLEDGGKSYIR
jgi:hypothetical protein